MIPSWTIFCVPWINRRASLHLPSNQAKSQEALSAGHDSVMVPWETSDKFHFLMIAKLQRLTVFFPSVRLSRTSNPPTTVTFWKSLKSCEGRVFVHSITFLNCFESSMINWIFNNLCTLALQMFHMHTFASLSRISCAVGASYGLPERRLNWSVKIVSLMPCCDDFGRLLKNLKVQHVSLMDI